MFKDESRTASSTTITKLKSYFVTESLRVTLSNVISFYIDTAEQNGGLKIHTTQHYEVNN